MMMWLLFPTIASVYDILTNRCQASAVAVSIAIATMLQGKHFDTNGEFNIKNMIKDCYEIASECLETSKQKSELKKYMKCTDLKEMKLDEEGKIGYTYKSMGSGFWALKQNNFRQAITEVMLQVSALPAYFNILNDENITQMFK